MSTSSRVLMLLLAAVSLVAVAWALLNPAWQAPDEPAHFGYTQLLAEKFELPPSGPGRPFSREQDTAMDAVNAGIERAAQLDVKPEWSREAYRRWQRVDARLPDSARGDGGGSAAGGNTARSNPPLYYLYESAPYLLASGGDVFDRLFLMRLWSAALLLVTVTATWLLVGEVFGPRPLLQLTAGALVGLQPMATFLTSSITPDGLLMAAWAVALWLGARILQRRLTLASGLGVCVAVATAVLTKATGWALIPAALLVLGTGAWRLTKHRGRQAALLPALCVAALIVPVAVWLALARVLDRPAINQIPGGTSLSGLNVRQFMSYLWQFYLPKLPFQTPFPDLHRLPVYDVWVKSGWAAFGWTEVRLPDAVYVVLAIVTVLLVAAGIVALLRRRQEGGVLLLALFAVVTLTLLAGLHWTEYRMITQRGIPFNSGRYLLPLLPLLGVGAAGCLHLLPDRGRRLVAAALLAGLVVLQAFSLAVVAGRFYA